MNVSESYKDLDADRISKLTSFVENILEHSDMSTYVPAAVQMDQYFEDVAVIITGLLDVAQQILRSIKYANNPQAVADGYNKYEVLDSNDMLALTEAMRKSLQVTELCLRQESSRIHIKYVPNMIRFT